MELIKMELVSTPVIDITLLILLFNLIQMYLLITIIIMC